MNGCQVALIGRVTRPGELKYASTGTAMLRVGVLIEDSKRREGDPPEYANVTIWGETAEQLAEQLPKGASVYIEGKGKAQAWKAQDGTPRASLDVSAWKAEPLGQIGRQAPRRRQEERTEPPRRMPQATAVAAGRNTRQALGLDDDEIAGWPE